MIAALLIALFFGIGWFCGYCHGTAKALTKVVKLLNDSGCIVDREEAEK